MYERILVPLDGSAVAEQALPAAAVHAQTFDAELILLRVIEPLTDFVRPSPALRDAETTMIALAQEYLEKQRDELEKLDIRVQAATVTGRTHEQILKFGETKQVDLIVICTRGRSGVSRWLMGSVADRVMRGARVPVLVVPAHQQGGGTTRESS